MIIGIIISIALVCGFIAGMIAYSKTQASSAFIVFFVIGAMFPVLGILIAALSKGPQVVVASGAGWYPTETGMHYWDGYRWVQ